MKFSLALVPVLCSFTSAQLLYPLLYKEVKNSAASPDSNQQVLHPHSDSMSYSSDEPTGTPLLADVLPQDPSISIFSDLTRRIESISTRVSNREVNTTVLASSNVAITKLPRKPWEDPDDEGAGGNIFSEIYKGLAGEDRATKNLRTFVEAHCVDVSPWPKGEKVKTLQGKEVWWNVDDRGIRRVCYAFHLSYGFSFHPTFSAIFDAKANFICNIDISRRDRNRRP